MTRAKCYWAASYQAQRPSGECLTRTPHSEAPLHRHPLQQQASSLFTDAHDPHGQKVQPVSSGTTAASHVRPHDFAGLPGQELETREQWDGSRVVAGPPASDAAKNSSHERALADSARERFGRKERSSVDGDGLSVDHDVPSNDYDVSSDDDSSSDGGDVRLDGGDVHSNDSDGPYVTVIIVEDDGMPSEVGLDSLVDIQENMELKVERAVHNNDEHSNEFEQNVDTAATNMVQGTSDEDKGHHSTRTPEWFPADRTVYYGYFYNIINYFPLVKVSLLFCTAPNTSNLEIENPEGSDRDGTDDNAVVIPEELDTSDDEEDVGPYILSLGFEYQFFGLRDNEIAKKPFVFTPGFWNLLRFRDGEQRKMIETASKDVRLEFFGEQADQSNPPPLIDILFPDNYFALRREIRETPVLMKMFADLIRILDTIVENKPNPPWDDVGVVYALAAQGFVLVDLTREIVKKKYFPGFEALLGRFRSKISVLQLSLREDDLPTDEHFRSDWAQLIRTIHWDLEALRKWNAWEGFLAGKSPKFDNIKKYTDFLPDSEPPSTCMVCLETVDETCDFGVMADCNHLFCSPCIEEWFRRDATCPICRRASVWMSREHFEFYVLPQIDGAERRSSSGSVPS